MTARRPRILLLVGALVTTLLIVPASPSHAAADDASTQVGWERVARVVWRKVQPWVLTLADVLFDTLTGDDGAPPPPPPEPIEPPPVPDPDYTP